MNEKIIKQGFLWRQGKKMIKRWQKRYFKLIGNNLYYFKQQNVSPTKKIDLHQVKYIVKTDEVKRENAIKMCFFNNDTIYLAADSSEESMNWIETIEKWRNTNEDDSDKATMNDFTTKEIGRNTRYKIQLAIKKSNNQIYLMKTYDLTKYTNANVEEKIEKEKMLFQSMNPFVTTLRYILKEDNILCLLYDYVPNELLFERLYEEGKFSETRAMFYASQILFALEYFHAHKIIYGDLKPGNILITGNGYAKITLPGIKLDNDYYRNNGNFEYKPPEVLSGENPKPSSDLYTFGILLYEMICGMPPFYDPRSDENTKTMINKEPVCFPYHVSKEARNLIEKLLEKDGTKRVSNINEIKSDPFFRNFDWNLAATREIPAEWIPNVNEKKDQIMNDINN